MSNRNYIVLGKNGQEILNDENSLRPGYIIEMEIEARNLKKQDVAQSLGIKPTTFVGVAEREAPCERDAGTKTGTDFRSRCRLLVKGSIGVSFIAAFASPSLFTMITLYHAPTPPHTDSPPNPSLS